MRSWRLGVNPDEMREADRRASDDHGLAPLVLMECAGLAVARIARVMLGGRVAGRAVSILAGPGNNGGDGLVAARHLLGWGARVTVHTSFDPGAARGVPATQVAICRAAGVPVTRWAADRDSADLAVDALLGFGAAGPPRGDVADMMASLDTGIPVLAVDLPSGVDAATGEPQAGAVRAATTVTLALPKTGLLAVAARPFVGALHVADIGLPPSLWAAMDVDVEGLFAEDDIPRVW